MQVFYEFCFSTQLVERALGTSIQLYVNSSTYRSFGLPVNQFKTALRCCRFFNVFIAYLFS
uniref:Putative ovule protein n=1 Tax=Solanum chacoense TaxID=4108 RepID=A0A0V0H7Z4_SOLCH